MSDPYRSADGAPCPRCKLALAPDEDGDLVCPDTCGRWITTATIVKLFGTSQLHTLRRPIAHWKATPFPPAPCIVCDRPLAEQYMPLPGGGVLSHGYCAEHGAWIDHATRIDFAAAYGNRSAAAEQAAARPRLLGDKERIAQLEQRVELLERRLAEVQDYVGRRKWTRWKE